MSTKLNLVEEENPKEPKTDPKLALEIAVLIMELIVLSVTLFLLLQNGKI